MNRLFPILLYTISFAAISMENIYTDSWAVVIGINKYENTRVLNYAVQDAESMQDILINTFDFPEKNITLLKNEQATKQNILKAFSDITNQAKENDRVLIFFSGHGETMDLIDGGEVGYLMPVDANKNNLYLSGIGMDDLKKLSLMSQAKHILYLIDACYGGLVSVGSKGLEPETTPNYIDKITREKSRQFITAGGKGEEVIEKSEWGHSAFTLNLLRGLEDGLADINNNGFIEARELGLFLSQRVTDDSENQQTPQYGKWTSHEGDFIFLNKQTQQDEIAYQFDSEVVAQILLEVQELKEQIVTQDEQSYPKPVQPLSQNIYYNKENRLSVSFPFGYSSTPPKELNNHIEGVHTSNETNYQPIFQVIRKAEQAISYGIAFNKTVTQKYGVELGFKKIQYIMPVRTVSSNYGFDHYIDPDLGFEFREEYQNINHDTYYLTLNSNILEYSILNRPFSVLIGVGLNYSSAGLDFSKYKKVANWDHNKKRTVEEWPSSHYGGSGRGYQMQIASEFKLFPRMGIYISYYIIQGYKGTLSGESEMIKSTFGDDYFSPPITTKYDNHILEDDYGNPLHINFFYQMMEVRLGYEF